MNKLKPFYIKIGEGEGGKLWDLFTSLGIRVFQNKSRKDWEDNDEEYDACFYDNHNVDILGCYVARAMEYSLANERRLPQITIEELINMYFASEEDSI